MRRFQVHKGMLMKSIFICLAISCLISTNNFASAQTTDTATKADITAPTEVGTTTMPAGQYLVIDQVSGKKYSLMVSSKGTMILGPAPVAAAAGAPAATTGKPTKTSTVESLAEKQVGNYIKNEGLSKMENMIK